MYNIMPRICFAPEVDGNPAPEPAPAPTPAPVLEPAPVPAPVEGDPKPVETPVPIDVAAIKFPEGAEINQEALTGFSALLSDTALSPQDRAQKLIDMHNDLVGKGTAKSAQDWVDRQAKARIALETDPTIGGPNLKQSQAYFTSVLSEFGNEALIAEINASGLSNSLEFGRFLVSIGKLTAEGKPVVGDPTSGGLAVSTADVLYPNQGKL